MKEAMHDKVCQLIGKYQAEVAYRSERAAASPAAKAAAVKAECCREFLMDLEKLLEER